MPAHPSIELFFPCVSERRMAEIVAEGDAFTEILIELKRARQVATHLRDFHRVRETRAIVIALARDEHLRLSLQPAKRLRVDHPVAIALEGEPRLIRRFR